MRDGMTRIKTFTNETEAQLVLNNLIARGVTGLIEVDNCGGMRPHMDLTGGVHLLVSVEDEEKALAVLNETDQNNKLPAWTCGSCGENIEAGFDTCWKCGATVG